MPDTVERNLELEERDGRDRALNLFGMGDWLAMQNKQAKGVLPVDWFRVSLPGQAYARYVEKDVQRTCEKMAYLNSLNADEQGIACRNMNRHFARFFYGIRRSNKRRRKHHA